MESTSRINDACRAAEAADRKDLSPGMHATIVDIIEVGSFWLLQADFGHGVAETPVEHRFMADIVAGVGVSSPRDLIGRRIWINRDGCQIAFLDGE